MCADSTGKMYWFARDLRSTELDSVLAIDTTAIPSLHDWARASCQSQGCLDHSGKYIFNPDQTNTPPNPDSNSLIIYDTQSDSVAAVYKICLDQSLPLEPGATLALRRMSGT